MRSCLKKFGRGFWTYRFVSVLAPIGPKLQPFTKYSRLTLILFAITHNRKSLISVFQQFFASTDKFLFRQEDWVLGYHSIIFRHISDVS